MSTKKTIVKGTGFVTLRTKGPQITTLIIEGHNTNGTPIKISIDIDNWQFNGISQDMLKILKTHASNAMKNLSGFKDVIRLDV